MKVQVTGDTFAHNREGRWHGNHALHRVKELGIGRIGVAPAHLIVSADTGCGEVLKFPVLADTEVEGHPRCKRQGCFSD